MFSIKLVTLLCVVISVLLDCVENKSYYGIGTRLFGDQLLVKDVLQAPPSSWSYNQEIHFNYAIPEPITYIKIISEENVQAKVNFSYNDDLVEGVITALNSKYHPTPITTAMTEFDKVAPFMVEISIYGFNDTVLNLKSEQVLNRDQYFKGILEPLYDDDEEFLNQSDEALVETFDEPQTDDVDLVGNDTNNGGAFSLDDDDDDDDDFEKYTDNIIELGHRQNGDYLIYETFQPSLTTSEEPTNHSIVFYYIDSNFITYVKFVIYDHFIDESLPDKNAPVAEYSHISQKTFKAVITEHHTKSFFAEMFVYGYKPEDRPHTYIPYLIRLQRLTLEDVATTMSSVQQLKMWLNEKQRGETKTTMPVPTNMSDDEDNKTDIGNDNGNELPLCRNAAFSMSSNLLTMTPYCNFIGISSFWVLLAVTLLFGI